MSKSKVKFINFVRHNLLYIVLALCILAVGLSVVFISISEKNKSNGLNNNLPTITDPDGDDTPVDNPDDTPEIPVVEEIIFAMPVSNPTDINEYSESMVWNGTLNRYSTHTAIDFFTEEGAPVYAVYGGVVESVEQKNDNRFEIKIKSPIEGNDKTYLTDSGKKPIVKVGQEVNPGDLVSEGLIHPKELLRVANVDAVEKYILKEVQKVYRSQGVDINDKHVELIARRMISQIRIIDSGDTNFLPSTVMSINKFTEGNKDVILQGKKPAIGQPILLGITKSSLQTDSFLASASFQETTRILTEAAVKGNVDHLHGLKENVIIGKLIPAGTGAKEYMDIGFSLEKEFFDDEPAEVLEEEFLD